MNLTHNPQASENILENLLQNNTLKNIVEQIRTQQPCFYATPPLAPSAKVLAKLPIGDKDLHEAENRLARWAKPLTILFPELAVSNGIIESPILPIAHIQEIIGVPLQGRALIKADHALPIAGSIKARGGIYEVLHFAETVAIKHGLIEENGDLANLITPEAKAIFSQYRISVGSTGNLGLSIGVMASALGFDTSVHMSADAKEWKKQRLRLRGVTVVEHTGDYATAVEAGRQQMADDSQAHFVDDENSLELFMGYAVAGLRLKSQLEALQITVDADHPLWVYLPCGVGGAPGGISWGLKQVFGDAVQCFFAEPTASPAFMVRMLSPSPVSVYDFGLNNQTEADGLAVGEASELVYSLVKDLLAGCFTVADEELFGILTALKQHENIQIEPSAAAGFLAPKRMLEAEVKGDLKAHKNVTHLFWTTGGSFVPEVEYEKFYQRGLAVLNAE